MKKRACRIAPALLCGFSVAFPYFLGGPLDVWVGNRVEFAFSVGDFIGWSLLLFFGVWLLLAALLMVLPEKVYPIFLGLTAWFGVMSCFQGLFLNFGMNYLVGDYGDGQKPALWMTILDTVLWVAAGVGCVIGALKMKKHEMVRMVATILLVVVCGMQLVGCVSLLPSVLSSEAETENETEVEDETETEVSAPSTEIENGATEVGTEAEAETATEAETETEVEEEGSMYLTTAGLNTVAPGKNIVIFVLDRFDTNYYDELIEKDPEMFDFLTGFTAYPDNISLYSRTYPAIASMVTGIRNDFSGSAEDYFAKAYGDSDFLKTLKQNDYAVRVYTADYYGYRDASVLAGIANNLNATSGYRVTDTGKLVGNMLALSAYRYLPTLLKSTITLSTESFGGIGVYGEAPAYEINDAAVIETLNGGLSLDSSCGQNAYTLIHLNGCHVSEGRVESAAKSCFAMIKNYLNEMKRLGVYEDATVIITGDHPSAVDDYAEPTQPRLTALFVKEAGRAEEPFRVSSAQVSQENNLLGTLVKSAGLKTDRDWGLAYSEVPEGVDMERHHLFEFTYESNTSAIMDFRVMGSGRDFANWKKVSQTDIGWLYK